MSTGPIGQFQASLLNREGVEYILVEIAKVVGVEEASIRKRFTNSWREEYEAHFNSAKTAGGNQPVTKRRGNDYTGSQFSINPNTDEDAELERAVIFGGSISRVFEVGPAPGGTLSRVETRLSLDNVRDSPLYDAFGLPEPGLASRWRL